MPSSLYCELMRRSFFPTLSLFIVSATLFSGCTLFPTKSAKEFFSTPENGTPSEAQKVGQTQKTGQLMKLNEKYYLQMPGQPPLEVDSYKIDLSSHVNTTVTVSGQYSGNTLFIGEIQ